MSAVVEQSGTDKKRGFWIDPRRKESGVNIIHRTEHLLNSIRLGLYDFLMSEFRPAVVTSSKICSMIAQRRNMGDNTSHRRLQSTSRNCLGSALAGSNHCQILSIPLRQRFQETERHINPFKHTDKVVCLPLKRIRVIECIIPVFQNAWFQLFKFKNLSGLKIL